jgi:RHS repeat-associated protein
MTDATKAKVWEIEARPFGDRATITGAGSLNLRFPGQYYDAETGLNYNYFRDYNSAIGRYIEADPIGIERGENHLFVYVQNNPVNWIDPKGLAIFNEACAKRVAGQVFKGSLSSRLPGIQIDDTPWNAYLHCKWNCEMVKQCGWTTAFAAGTGHELYDKGRIPIYEQPASSMMDLNNNAAGRDCGKNKCTTCDECCRYELNFGNLIHLKGHGASGTW